MHKHNVLRRYADNGQNLDCRLAGLVYSEVVTLVQVWRDTVTSSHVKVEHHRTKSIW